MEGLAREMHQGAPTGVPVHLLCLLLAAEPFAFADFTWLTQLRTHAAAIDTPVFPGEFAGTRATSMTSRTRSITR